MQKALNAVSDGCSNFTTEDHDNLDCGCVEAATFADPGVRAVNGNCGCDCLNCCYHALNAGGDVDCPAPHCGFGPVKYGPIAQTEIG